MELNKCTRCGCFYVSSNDVCPTCEQKDVAEIDKLKIIHTVSLFASFPMSIMVLDNSSASCTVFMLHLKLFYLLLLQFSCSLY